MGHLPYTSRSYPHYTAFSLPSEIFAVPARTDPEYTDPFFFFRIPFNPFLH